MALKAPDLKPWIPVILALIALVDRLLTQHGH
jgi:hypothetical protein